METMLPTGEAEEDGREGEALLLLLLLSMSMTSPPASWAALNAPSRRRRPSLPSSLRETGGRRFRRSAAARLQELAEDVTAGHAAARGSRDAAAERIVC